MRRKSVHPARWKFQHGAWYYRVPPGLESQWDGKKWFRLGKTEGEAYRTWYERVGHDTAVYTMNDLFDAWWTGYVLPYLKESTHESYGFGLQQLRLEFGDYRPERIRVADAYRYRATRPRVAGNREMSILSSALSYGVEIGAIERNVLRGQITRRGGNAEPVRDRVPTLEEIEAFCEANPRLKGYVSLKLLTGLRQGQLLAINLTEHWNGTTLHPPASKGGKDTRYKGQRLGEAIAFILHGRLPVGPLFANRRGKRESATGFKSKWARAMAKYVAAGGERFNEHDIRKTVATEAETLELAQKLMGHQDARTTSRIYRIGPVDVEV